MNAFCLCICVFSYDCVHNVGESIAVPEQHTPLRDEIQAMSRDMKLLPSVRVDYTRIAFQSIESADQSSDGPDRGNVRITVDINMRMLLERASAAEWRTPDSQLATEDEIMFPYYVIEIKCRTPHGTNRPAWLDDLERSPLMRKEDDFSKYLHAAYAFDAMHGGVLKLRKPVWWDPMDFASPPSVSRGQRYYYYQPCHRLRRNHHAPCCINCVHAWSNACQVHAR